MRAQSGASVAWARFAGSDPGLLRLMAATRTVGAVALTLLALAALHTPVMLLVAGAMTAMISSVAVNEPRLRDQAVTLALALPTALTAVAAGTLLAPYRVVADVFFIVLIFAAVYARRYGDRSRGLGMIAFQMFFVAQFIQAKPDMLPGLWKVLAVALACGAFVRFAVLRVTPEKTLRRVLHAFRGRLAGVAAAMAVLVEQQQFAARPGRSPLRAQRTLSKRVARLHECVLMLQSWIDDSLSGATAGALRRRVAEADVATQRLAALLMAPPGKAAEEQSSAGTGSGAEVLAESLRALRLLVEREGPLGPGADRGRLRSRLLNLRDGPGDAQVSPEVREALRATGEVAFTMLGVRLAAGRDAAEDSGRTDERFREELDTEDLALETPGRPTGEGAPALAEDEQNQRGLRRPTTRAACQVAVGSALAILGGELLSERRWYWAVITCWVVFLNTSSTGEILVKGSRRLTGTMIGVVAGVGLTALVAGHVTLTFALVLVCVFAMFFTAPLSYVLMSFFTTTMLGLLYTLLHTYTPSLMVLRMEETALGAACGLVAALVVLPVRTTDHVNEQLENALVSLREVLDTAGRQLGGESGVDVLAAVRASDTALDDLRDATRPLTHPVSPLRGRRGSTQYVLSLVNSCGYHARAVASGTQQQDEGAEFAQDLRERTDRIIANLQVLIDGVSTQTEGRGRGRQGGSAGQGSSAGALVEWVGESGEGRADREADADPSDADFARSGWIYRHVQRLDAQVIGLAEPLGARVVESTPAGGRPA